MGVEETLLSVEETFVSVVELLVRVVELLISMVLNFLLVVLFEISVVWGLFLFVFLKEMSGADLSEGGLKCALCGFRLSYTGFE